MRYSKILAVAVLLLILVLFVDSASGWSNGGYSSDPNNPDYGTHDWIAERALDWIPVNEMGLILTYRAAYLYGTELPDNSQLTDGVGDTTLHHIYFFANGTVQDDSAATRTQAMQAQVAAALLLHDYALAAKWTGAMAHYIADMAVFGHVMGATTDWGAEHHHSDYEDHIQTLTSSPAASSITLTFDGILATITPHDAALALARDTTFDLSGAGRTAVWMDQHYNWSDPVFVARAYQSINLAVNYVAEAVHNPWSSAVVTTTTSVQVTTSTTTAQATTTTTSYQATTTTTQSPQTTTIPQTVDAGSSGVGFAFAFIGVGVGAAAVGIGLAVGLSGEDAIAYRGYYYCRRHRVPAQLHPNGIVCPVDGRLLRLRA